MDAGWEDDGRSERFATVISALENHLQMQSFTLVGLYELHPRCATRGSTPTLNEMYAQAGRRTEAVGGAEARGLRAVAINFLI